MNGAPPLVQLSASWPTHQLDGELNGSATQRWLHLWRAPFDDGMALAEDVMTTAQETDATAEMVELTDPPASTPWLQLTLATTASALCICCSARVLQIHQDDDDIPLLTVEGQSVGPALYAHYLHSGTRFIPLLLSNTIYKVKFFARYLKSRLELRCVGLLLSEEADGMATIATAADAEESTSFMASGEVPSPPLGLDALSASLEVSLQRLEAKISLGMSAVLDRLESIEVRLKGVESALQQ